MFKPMFQGHTPPWHGKFFKVIEPQGKLIYLSRRGRQ